MTNDIFKVLRIKPFLFMMVSEFFSQFAFNMQNFVLIFIVYGITHSNTAVSGIVLSFTIPAVFLSLVSGVYVDRWDKKKVLFFTNLIRGLLLLFFLIPSLHVGFIYTLTFFIAVATQFFIPAESAFIPRLVPQKLILPANSIFTLGIYSTILMGYVVSGPSLLLLGKTATIIFLSALFLTASLVTLLIKPVSKGNVMELQPKNNDILDLKLEIQEIFTFLRKAKKVMRALIAITLAQAIIFTFSVLAPGYMTSILNVQIESLSWILLAPAGLGMGFGALLLGTIGKRYEHKWLIKVGFIISGVIFILFPFASKVTSRAFIQTINDFLPNFLDITILHIVIVLAFIVGFANSLIFVTSNTAIQISAGEDIRGRIYGLLNALVGAVSFLPVVLAGALADLLGVGTVITAIGILMLLISVLFSLFD